MISKDEKNELIKTFRVHDADTGSAQVQVAVLTARIQQLTEHLKTNKKDFSSRRGLLKMVGRRRRLLKYLRDDNLQGYSEVITRLGLRK
ncbi:MAG: 30S ribosomal protein S15 [Deltaproteobacteria bacterium]|nr:30S ribosomal protein S15 [Deltaproteobacteria bacterium]